MPAGTVLMSSRAPVGYAVIASQPLATNQGFKSFVLKGDLVPEYFYYFLLGNKDLLLKHASGTTFLEVSGKNAARIPVPVAPAPEQRRIVLAIEEHLSRLDAAVAALERVRASLPRYRATMLKAACQGRLLEADRHADQAADVPNGWTIASLAGLKKRSLYGPRFSSDLYSDEGPLVLRTTDISDGGKVNLQTAPRIRIDADGLERYRVRRGDLLFTRTGSLGTVALFDDNVAAIPGAYLIQYSIAAPLTTARYILRFFQSPFGQRELVKGGAGVGRPNLNAPAIEAIPIPIPPLDEQERILAEIDRRLSLVDAAERAVSAGLAKAKRLRQAILKRAFEGKLVPQDPNDEPASVLLEGITKSRASK